MKTMVMTGKRSGVIERGRYDVVGGYALSRDCGEGMRTVAQDMKERGGDYAAMFSAFAELISREGKYTDPRHLADLRRRYEYARRAVFGWER